MSGTIVFSVLEHKPKNYEEVSEIETEDGKKAVRTRTNETMEIVGKQEPPLKIKYTDPEDIINIVTNEAPDRKTLIRVLYETRELDPKKGKWFLNNPWKVSLDDLVVSNDEWEHFLKRPRKENKTLFATTHTGESHASLAVQKSSYWGLASWYQFLNLNLWLWCLFREHPVISRSGEHAQTSGGTTNSA